MIEIKAEEELMTIIDRGELDGKNIYMMGSVPNAERIQGVLLKRGLSLCGIYDNNPSKYGMINILGKEIMITHPPRKKTMDEKATVVIVLSIRFWLEMAEQLLEIGFKEQENLFILEALTLDKKKKYVELGYKIYTERLKKYGSNAYLLVFHGPIGDNYLFASFLKQFVDNNGMENPVCLGTKATEKIHTLFKLPNYETISREEVVALEFFYMFVGKKCSNLKILQIWEFQFHFNRERIRFDERFSFIDTYRSYIFHLPVISKPADPQYEGIVDKIKEDFKVCGLQPGRTVILAPYAYSININPSRIFWKSLVGILKDNGRFVCLNSGDDEENFLSIPTIHFSIAESGNYLEVAGAFVGMRSGFCDVTAKAKCKKVLLYPKRYSRIIDYDRHRNDLEFGSVKRMELCDDAVELEFAYKDLENDYWERLAKVVADNILRG